MVLGLSSCGPVYCETTYDQDIYGVTDYHKVYFDYVIDGQVIEDGFIYDGSRYSYHLVSVVPVDVYWELVPVGVDIVIYSRNMIRYGYYYHMPRRMVFYNHVFHHYPPHPRHYRPHGGGGGHHPGGYNPRHTGAGRPNMSGSSGGRGRRPGVSTGTSRHSSGGSISRGGSRSGGGSRGGRH